MDEAYERAGTVGFRCVQDSPVPPPCTDTLCGAWGAPPGIADLTEQGGVDWVKFGLGAFSSTAGVCAVSNAPGAIARKKQGSSASGWRIGALTTTAAGCAVRAYDRNPNHFSWSDSAGSGSGAATAESSTGVFTAPSELWVADFSAAGACSCLVSGPCFDPLASNHNETDCLVNSCGEPAPAPAPAPSSCDGGFAITVEQQRAPQALEADSDMLLLQLFVGTFGGASTLTARYTTADQRSHGTFTDLASSNYTDCSLDGTGQDADARHSTGVYKLRFPAAAGGKLEVEWKLNADTKSLTTKAMATFQAAALSVVA